MTVNGTAERPESPLAGGDLATVVVRPAGTAPATWALGMLAEQLIGGQDGGGQLGVSVVTQPPGQASPLHVHTHEDEAWYLLEGTLTYRAGEQTVRMAAGDFIFLPRNVPHAFRTTGTVPVRFLALTVPGGLMSIYDEVGVPAPARRLPDGRVSPTETARWLELGPKYGLRVVGPPIPEADA